MLKRMLLEAFDDLDYDTVHAGEKLKLDNAIAIIHHGVVAEIVSGDREILVYRKPGDWLGLEGLLPKSERRIVSAWHAETLCVVSYLKHAEVLENLSPLARALLGSSQRKAHKLLTSLQEAGDPVEARMDRALGETAELLGTQTTEGYLIPSLNRTNLARLANTSRESVTRYLTRLCVEGKAKRREGRGIIIT